MSGTNRKGMTLVELLIVIVVGGVLLAATYEVLVNQQRAYQVEHFKVRDQRSLRGALEVLFAELREVSAPGGDLIEIGQDSMQIRVGRTFGLVCDNDYPGGPTLTVKYEGEWFEALDSVFVLADAEPAIQTDDQWFTRQVTAVDTTGETCPTGPVAQKLTIPGLPTGANDTIQPGAPVRSFQHYLYGLYEVGGEWYLARRAPGGDVSPLVGPLRSRAEGGLVFRYYDEDGVVTAVPAEVAQIEVVLRTQSEVAGTSDVVSDSIVTRINTRN